MQVFVLVPSVLRAEAGGESKLRVTLPDGATLGQLFDAVANTHPRLERRVRDEQGRIRRYVNVFVDGEESRHIDGVAARLRDSVEVHIIPSVAGG
ncbi:MAG: ubiquitin-like small modifier protein 1 [Micromonosporaceae bacterium]